MPVSSVEPPGTVVPAASLVEAVVLSEPVVLPSVFSVSLVPMVLSVVFVSFPVVVFSGSFYPPQAARSSTSTSIDAARKRDSAFFIVVSSFRFIYFNILKKSKYFRIFVGVCEEKKSVQLIVGIFHICGKNIICRSGGGGDSLGYIVFAA